MVGMCQHVGNTGFQWIMMNEKNNDLTKKGENDVYSYYWF